MVNNENQAAGQGPEKPQGVPQRQEHQKTEQHKPDQQNRRGNSQVYGQNQGNGQGRAQASQGNTQNQRGQNQAQQGGPQGGATQSPIHRDAQSHNTGMSSQGNQGHSQPQPRNSSQGARNSSERHEGYLREGGQNRGYYRERNRERDGERENQPRQHPGNSSSGSRYANIQRIRAEETVDDIKEDIIRLEKEIELEIKEIRSLKL